jgi:hypothetical protein
MAIIGLIVSYVWLRYTPRKEGFAIFGLSEKDQINTKELAFPHPYRPVRETKDAPYADRPYTPYMDFRAGSEEDMLEDDPRDLDWIASWSAADQFARRGHNCVPIFKTAGPDGTVIETTSKSCESGMPHTLAGDRIIIPDSIPEPLKAEIIGHEMIHIYQRRFPEAWRDFYRRSWSFELHEAPPDDMPASVVEARRANPDTRRAGPWSAWMGRYWPVPVYTNPQSPSLREAVTIWWDTWSHKILTEPPQAWTAFFGKPTQDEHPHEIAAVLLMADDYSTEAGRRLMSWWNSAGEILKAKHKGQSENSLSK